MIISRPIHVAANGIVSLFLRLSNSPLYICTTPLSVHLSIDIQVASMPWLLKIVLLWTLVCMYLFDLEFSLDIGPGVGLLDHLITLFLVFWGTSILFSIVAESIYIPTNSVLLLLSHFSCVRLCATPWSAAHQAPLSLGFSRQEHWSGFSNAWKWKVKVKLLSCVRPSVTPWTAAYQALPSMGFSRQEHWSGVPLPSPMRESEKWKGSCSVVSYS